MDTASFSHEANVLEASFLFVGGTGASVKNVEAVRAVIGEDFSLFVGRAYNILKSHAENLEDLPTARKLVSEMLIADFWILTSGHVLGVLTNEDDPNSTKRYVTEDEQFHIERYVSQALTLHIELQGLTRPQIQQTYSNFINTYLKRRDEKLKKVGERHDLEAFFNETEAQADWLFWNAKPIWAPEEFIALSFGKDPRVVNETTLRSLKPLAGSPFRDKFFNRLDGLNRAIGAKIVKPPLRRAGLARWATSTGIQLPDAISTSHVGDGDKINTNILHKYCQILLGLAIKHYGYDILRPKDDKQSAIASKIAEHLVEVGAKIGAKSLARYLSEAQDWVSSETAHSLLLRARKAAAASERLSLPETRQKP